MSSTALRSSSIRTLIFLSTAAVIALEAVHIIKIINPENLVAALRHLLLLFTQMKRTSSYRSPRPRSHHPEAHAAGAAPFYRGQAGYGEHLDRDNDGIACEPYYGR
jgi:hypothetical protein